MVDTKDIMENIKNIVGDVFGFNKKVLDLENTISTLDLSIDDLHLQIKNALEADLTKTQKMDALQKIVDAGGKSIKEKNYLPEVFSEAKNVYKFGFWLKTTQGDSYLEPIDAGGHIVLTSFLYHIINKANIKPTDDALAVFNKILGTQQTYTTYIYDQNQWGEAHGENWTPSICVLNTKKDDCESLSCLAVSAFEYYRMIENKFPEAYAFVGTGWYNWKNTQNKCGHGFPCLYIKSGKSLEESMYIGEATLHSSIPAKSLKDAKNMYEISWGCNSFWHDFKLKSEFAWWTNSTAGQGIPDVSFEEKKKMIEDFWK